MFERVTVYVREVDECLPGYGAIIGSEDPWPDFELVRAGAEHAPTQGLHIAFSAPDRATIAERWQAAILAGFTDDGEPGPRSVYSPGYHGGFVLDPAGNSLESVNHEAGRQTGRIDHVWIRVPDIEAARPRFAALAEGHGVSVTKDQPGWLMFSSETGSLSLRQDGQPETRSVRFVFSGGPEIEL
ncbi:MAG: hypothetical protein ACSLFI_13550 [Solirubrobacterales bacterium]